MFVPHPQFNSMASAREEKKKTKKPKVDNNDEVCGVEWNVTDTDCFVCLV
jgi:hypothetical protein